jgi:hypothetical protein
VQKTNLRSNRGRGVRPGRADSHLRTRRWGREDSNLRRTEPLRLQRSPFDRFGTPPARALSLVAAKSAISRNARPVSISYFEYLGPPRVKLARASIAPVGMNHLLPSPTWTKQKSHLPRSKYFVTPFQLWFPPRVERDTFHRSFEFWCVVVFTSIRSARPSISATRSMSGLWPTGTLSAESCAPG